MEDLYAKLRDLHSLPMHMPGHKRNSEKFPWLYGCDLDITEIAGFDDLNAPQGLFADLEVELATLRGATRSFALVNGSTCGVLAAIRTCVKPGQTLLLARNSHRSAWHGAELAGARVETLLPPLCGGHDFYGAVPLETLPPDCAAVLVTSPTYEGVIADIPALAARCHAAGVPLLVDAAHGAHLGYGPFPADALAQGADLVVESLHKTLPSLTQTATLHLRGHRIDGEELARNLAIFQSSSPSYLLSAAIAGCVRWLQGEGREALAHWHGLLQETRHRLEGLLLTEDTPGVYALDPSKLVFTGTDGFALMEALRARGIELEMASRAHALAMTGPGDTAESLHRLAAALEALSPLPPAPPFLPPPAPGQRALTLAEAVRLPWKLYPLAEAVGRLSAAYVAAYPPGIPLLTPGERITPETAAYMAANPRQYPGKLRCIDEKSTHLP